MDHSTNRLKDFRTDSHLPYIAREAARIVARFRLPEEIHPPELITRFAQTVENGNKNYRKHVREGIRSKGYEEIFPELLKEAADLVFRDLKQILPERKQSGEKAKESTKKRSSMAQKTIDDKIH